MWAIEGTYLENLVTEFRNNDVICEICFLPYASFPHPLQIWKQKKKKKNFFYFRILESKSPLKDAHFHLSREISSKGLIVINNFLFTSKF